MEDPPNHFFKFIPPCFNFNLSIPKSFWINLKVETCRKAVLKRGRREWQVAISDNGVFGDGWRKLMIDNGIKEFDFIVFKHQGKMVFDFMVFDQSRCERQYPDLLDEIDVEDHIHDERSKKSKKRKRNDYLSRKDDKSHLGGDSCFKIVMTPYSIESSRLCFPTEFARSNGFITEDTQDKVVHTKAVIVDEAQRTWSATLQTNRKRVLLGGWRELKIKYPLKAGDSCMFELVKLGEVSVFSFCKLGKNPVGDSHIHVQKETSLKSKEETNIKSNNHSYFNSTLKPCTFRKSCLYLPASFSVPNGLKIGEMILRNDKGRSWKIQLRKTGGNSFYLGRGLKDFCDANGLKVGDAYKFELVENEKDKPPIVNFSLNVDRTMNVEEPLRGSDSVQKLTSLDALDVEEPQTLSNSNYTDEMTTKKHKKRKRHDYASQSKNDFQFQVGEDRSFVVVMTPYCIRSSRLTVPQKFARSNSLINERPKTVLVKQIVMIDEAQRTWPAKLKIRSNQVRMTCWHKLKVKHNLEAGDTCYFELVKLGEVPVFNFYRKKPVENNNSQAEVEMDSTTKKGTSSTLKSHPYFTSTLNHKRIAKAGLVTSITPKSYANGLKLGEIILRYNNHGSWKGQIVKHSEKTFSLARGFRDFCYENGLKEGNEYKFEIVEDQKDNPPVLNVSLCEDLAPGKKNNPFFLGEVKSYVVEKMLYLPKKFARKNGLIDKEEMIIKNVRKEGSWTPVELKRSKNNKHCYIGRGWKEFYVANGLKDGDLFKFELVDNGEKPTANFRFQSLS